MEQPPSSKAMQAFIHAIAQALPTEQVITDIARRIALSTDASFYQLTPQVIIKAASIGEVQQVLRCAAKHQVSVTFRAAGTSLSGQAVSDSVLLMLTADWQQYAILDDGHKIRLQPGIIGARANQLLAPYQRKIGPDPASIASCKIGGIAANNASGMCCGTKQNSYHTLAAITIMLADGTLLDTGNKDSRAAFAASHQALLSQLSDMREQIQHDEQLSAKIRHQFRLKNTMGYGLNALLDYDDPIDVLAHLMIGSEGTLGFIADITYHTVELPKHRACALYVFDSAHSACNAIELLAPYVDSAELMDSRALQAVAELLAPYYQETVDPNTVALLLDIGTKTAGQLERQCLAVHEGLVSEAYGARAACAFTQDQHTIDALWQIRKGLFPAVGAVRMRGTTVIIEDIAFGPDQLAEGMQALRDTLDAFGYQEAIIFGHALAGNLHFVFTQSFNTPEDITRYDAFMQQIAKVVCAEFDGTLKAEHGTGRNMAPFLVHQWGEDGLAIMRQIKQLLDPQGLLNPGVILNEDSQAHVSHLKHLPSVDETVDSCIECGFCESDCPSLNLTLSPRQRIALARRTHQLSLQDKQHIDQASQWLTLDSCAATGLCARACPVGINTGEWVKQQRGLANNAQATQRAYHSLASTHSIARFALTTAQTVAKLTGPKWLERASEAANRATQQKLPVWYQQIPRGAEPAKLDSKPFAKKVVLFNSCPNRVFASPKGQPPLSDVVIQLCNKAGIEVIVASTPKLCCGQPFASKGDETLAKQANSDLADALVEYTENGRWPIITEASPCALASLKHGLVIDELAHFLLQDVVPHLTIKPLYEPIMLHKSCSSQHLDGASALQQLANLVSNQVIVPHGISCCGFAGDKGLHMPELNQSALNGLAQQIPTNCTRGVSNSRTCEIGLTRNSGIQYQHIAYLLNEVSQSEAVE